MKRIEWGPFVQIPLCALVFQGKEAPFIWVWEGHLSLEALGAGQEILPAHAICRVSST